MKKNNNFQIYYNIDEPRLLKNQVCICFYIGVPPGYQDDDDCPTMYDEIKLMVLKWSCDNPYVRLAIGIDGATGPFSMDIGGPENPYGGDFTNYMMGDFTMATYDAGVMFGAMTPGDYLIEISGAYNDDFNFCFFCCRS